jgi:GT2 family glycosyltransferase
LQLIGPFCARFRAKPPPREGRRASSHNHTYDLSYPRQERPDSGAVAVVLLTHNRLPTLRMCVDNVLSGLTEVTGEVVIWNNGSEDGTSVYLASLADPRFRVIDAAENVGMVAYGRAIKLTTAPYIVQLDDDVIRAPRGWDRTLLDAARRLPEFGFLAADVEPNSADRLSYERHHVHQYDPVELRGMHLLEGPTGGWCTITSRRIYDEVGGLPLSRRLTYFSTDTVYVKRLARHHYRHAILPDLRVRHDGDRLNEPPSPAKRRFHERRRRNQRAKDFLKRVLVVIPFVGAANRRFRWFEDPRR